MPKPRITGGTGIIKKPAEINYDPSRGITYTQPWECAGDNLGGLANVLIGQGTAFRWVRGGARSELTANASGAQAGLPDNAALNWQLLCNEVQKDVMESPLAMNLEASYPGSLVKVAHRYQTRTSGDPDDAADNPTAGSEVSYGELLDMLIHKQTHFATGQFVLRRTYSISNFYAGNLPGDELAERVLSTQEVLTLGMPPVYSQKISSIVSPYIAPGYIWGWRQLPSTMVTAANNRVEVNTEWWLDSWRLSLYPAA